MNSFLQPGCPILNDGQRLTVFLYRLPKEELFAVPCHTVVWPICLHLLRSLKKNLRWAILEPIPSPDVNGHKLTIGAEKEEFSSILPPPCIVAALFRNLPLFGERGKRCQVYLPPA